MNILAICGSLREASYNRMLLKAAAAAAPDGVRVTLHDTLRDIPPFDGDDLAKGYPVAVQRLRDAIRDADGVLFGSPEYNFSISGVLKNAIDWASRGTDQPFNGKPYAIMSASMGPLGGGRSQYDLRKIMVFLNAFGLNKPEIFVGQAQNKFDAAGHLTDETTRKLVGEQMVAFANYIGGVKRGFGGA